MKEVTTYNRTSQIFHWVSALLIISLLVMGTIMVRVDDANPLKTNMYRGHVTFGMLTLLITVGRIVWLFRSTKPIKLEMPKWESFAFTWNHRLLYVLILLVAISGISMLLASGLSLVPTSVTPAAIQDVPPRVGHGIFTKVLLLFFLMHVGGVMFYQFSRGNTLGRMGVNWLNKTN